MQLSSAKKIAYDLLKQENLLRFGWQVKFDDAKNRLGSSHYGKRLITLSRYFIALNADSVTLDTIRHEVAHALTPGDGEHGADWRREAERLGAAPAACTGGGTTVAPPGYFVGTCPGCGHRTFQHRAASRIGRTACAECCRQYAEGKFDAQFLYHWKNEKTGEIFRHGGWEKDERGAAAADTAIAESFASKFGTGAVIEIKQIGALPQFRFDDYDFRRPPEGVFRALLEVKLFRRIKEHRVLKTYWRTASNERVVIDVWANTFNGGKYETADKRADVEKLKVGKFYELIVMNNDRGYARLQTAKLSG